MPFVQNINGIFGRQYLASSSLLVMINLPFLIHRESHAQFHQAYDFKMCIGGPGDMPTVMRKLNL